ncbi:FAD-binding oxidoreductase [Rhizobium pusense]|uniref:FAD-dependent oxidoreductase n=1 Tax=Agrobacterium pusense TaxID=648995 RepID=UPI002448AD6B|nr:FAD-dependent oxidoreductase [Agrobacterium pusense]MDH1270468.1 FAD-binding oxidoreductase [Agrobacterium pusense]
MKTRSLLIIGGGIIGHMVAWKACASDPKLEVTILERDLPGSGASAHAAGLHFPLSRTAGGRQYSLNSQQFYLSAVQQEPSLPISPLALRIHCAPADFAMLQEAMTEGANLEVEPNEMAVTTALDSHLPIWTAVGANRAEVHSLVLAIRRNLGGRLRVIDGLRVHTIEERTSGITVNTHDGLSLNTDLVVLAPGPWALDEPFRPYTKELGLRIKRVVAFHVDESDVPRDSVDLFFEVDAFLMPRADGKTLFSFTRIEWDVSPDASGRGVSSDDRADAEAVIKKVAPRLSGKLLGGQAFCDAYSRNRVPIATTVGDSGRIAFAGGANGSGYRFAPAIADNALSAIGVAS